MVPLKTIMMSTNMDKKKQMQISERSIEFGAAFAKAWRECRLEEMEENFNNYVKMRRMLPRGSDGKRFESYCAYLSTQGEFEG
jgi:hypothetical protein